MGSYMCEETVGEEERRRSRLDTERSLKRKYREFVFQAVQEAFECGYNQEDKQICIDDISWKLINQIDLGG